MTGLSIGYRTLQSHFDDASNVRVLTKIELLEVSMVTFPANEFARVSRVKSRLAEGQMPNPRELEAFLRDAGFSRKQAKGLIADGYKALSPRDAGAGAGADEAQVITGLAQKILSLIND